MVKVGRGQGGLNGCRCRDIGRGRIQQVWVGPDERALGFEELKRVGGVGVGEARTQAKGMRHCSGGGSHSC